MHRPPVLYLDLDDTIVSWEGGKPHAAPSAADFFRWALEHFEIRWLTTWCPGGSMDEKLLRDLSSMVEIPVQTLREITGSNWEGTETKLNGVAWLEHVVLGRPFVWLEDQYGFSERERRFLTEHGFEDSYVHCNVTEDRNALTRAFCDLRNRLVDQDEAAA